MLNEYKKRRYGNIVENMIVRRAWNVANEVE